MRSQSIRIEQFGGPDVLQLRDIEVPPPAAGEATVRHTAIGVNFIDIYHRTGLYPLELPTGLGSEAAGIVEAVGDDVEDVAVGDRANPLGRARHDDVAGIKRIETGAPGYQLLHIVDQV